MKSVHFIGKYVHFLLNVYTYELSLNNYVSNCYVKKVYTLHVHNIYIFIHIFRIIFYNFFVIENYNYINILENSVQKCTR